MGIISVTEFKTTGLMLQYYNHVTKATGDFDYAVHKKTQDSSPKESCAIYGSGERGIAKLKANSPGPAWIFCNFL